VTEIYTRLVARALFPLHEQLKGHDTVRRLHALEESQWWSPEQIRASQAERLHTFLARVAASVPYYKAMFATCGFNANSVTGAADLARLPLLTKGAIRVNAELMKSNAAGPLKRYNTGGSSGEPLIFFMGKDRISHDVAAKWRATRWWGVDIGDPEIVIWGSPIELGAQDRLRTLRDKLLRTRLLPAFEMSEAKLDGFLDVIRRHRPRMLFGYPSALSLIAHHAHKRGIRLNDLGVRVAFVTSERLYDDQRKTIAEIFACPVANGYGGRDAGFIAHECPEGSMHIAAEDVILETVDAAGKPVAAGAPGEIVVTHLATGDFPFVRYRTGDIGVLGAERCACGRGLPVLKELRGRSTDFVVAADGTVMHGLALIYVLRDLPGIDRFKIEQESISLTRILVVPGEGFESGLIGRIERGIKARLGADVHVDVQIVSDVAPERSGKFRYVVSHVATA